MNQCLNSKWIELLSKCCHFECFFAGSYFIEHALFPVCAYFALLGDSRWLRGTNHRAGVVEQIVTFITFFWILSTPYGFYIHDCVNITSPTLHLSGFCRQQIRFKISWNFWMCRNSGKENILRFYLKRTFETCMLRLCCYSFEYLLSCCIDKFI